MAKGSGNNSLKVFIFYFPNHWVSFPTASLTIGKDSTIVSCEYILYKIIRSFSIYSLLMGTDPKNIIEGKSFNVICFIRFLDCELIIILVNMHDIWTSSILLLLIHRSDSDHNLNSFAHRKLLEIIKSKKDW